MNLLYERVNAMNDNEHARLNVFLISCLITAFFSIIIPSTISEDLTAIHFGFPFRYCTVYNTSFNEMIQSKILMTSLSFNVFVFLIDVAIVYFFITLIKKIISKQPLL